MTAKEFKLTEMDREILKSYQYMLDVLALYLGDSYEIVLHSLEDLGHSVIKIINGHYTKREVGAPITDLALSMLHNIQKSQTPHSMVYFNRREGRTLKSVTIPVVGEGDRIIGLVCMNFQCDVPFSQFISAFLPTASDMTISRETESFNADIDEVISTAMAKARENVSASANIPSTNRNKEIIRQLYQQGIFNIKDSVVWVSESLGISKNTVYLHLRNLKQELPM